MGEPFLGSEALRDGRLTRHRLRTGFVALHRDVYLAAGEDVTPVVRAKACWLRSRRRGVLAGFSASALHGSRWIDPDRPAEIIDTNRRPDPAAVVWEESIGDDEICLIDGVRVSIPARTALDLARHHPPRVSVAAVDALIHASGLAMPEIASLARRYRGRRGMRRAQAALALVDPGAESPKETWLRLLLIRSGLPRPRTQIPIYDQWGRAEAYLDMGWPELKVAVEYDGEHHRTDRRQYVRDIRRAEMLDDLGWIVVRVVAGDRPEQIVARVRAAMARRAAPAA
jgi:very-short-patch-repair endonuclease